MKIRICDNKREKIDKAVAVSQNARMERIVGHIHIRFAVEYLEKNYEWIPQEDRIGMSVHWNAFQPEVPKDQKIYPDASWITLKYYADGWYLRDIYRAPCTWRLYTVNRRMQRYIIMDALTELVPPALHPREIIL